MKTQRILLVLLCLSFYWNGATAQTYYYTERKYLTEGGVSYWCEPNKDTGLTLLFNSNNKWTNVPQKYKDGKAVGDDILLGRVDLIKDDNWTKRRCNSIINNAFTTAQKKAVKGIPLGISMFINTTTGKVSEVNFVFTTKGGFGTIPLSVYKKIEDQIKSQIWFTLTNKGRELNYVERGWMHEVE